MSGGIVLKRVSVGRVILALFIVCVYVFLFGIVQVVHVSADTEYELEVPISRAEQADRPAELLTEHTTVNINDERKPTAADGTAATTANMLLESETPKEYPPALLPPDNSEEPDAPNEDIFTLHEYSETQAPQTEPPQTQAPQTESPQTDAPETTLDEEAPPSSNGESPDEEQLTVIDLRTGERVTDSAREIVTRAVIGEIWNEFPGEAVKAQAVATYTYIKKNNMQGEYPKAVYYPTRQADLTERMYSLVDEVLGEAIYYDGEMIQSVFFASSCGYTNSSINVWCVDYPYLRSVDCPFDESTDPNWGDIMTVSSEEVKQRILKTLGISLDGNPADWFRIISRLDGREKGWITSISVGGMTKANGKNIDGRVFRETVFSYLLKSAAFDLSYDEADDSFTFTTYGHGHGVGMSQYGAKALAEQGYTYTQILKHYFTGVEIY